MRKRLRGRRQWTRPIGILLVGLAASLALDPDYPVPRASSLHASARRSEVLQPELAEPRGDCPAGVTAFRWRARDDEPWQLVVIGDDLVERFRGPAPDADLPAELTAVLAGGGDFYWRLERPGEPPVRSQSLWFRVPAAAVPTSGHRKPAESRR